MRKGVPLTHDVRIDKALMYLADNIDKLIDTPWKNRWQGTQWDDISIPALSLGTTAATPDKINFVDANGLHIYGFDGNATAEMLEGSFKIPHGWREQGSVLHPHVNWCPTDTGAGNVKWHFQYSWADINETFAAPITLTIVQSTNGIAWQHLSADFQPDLTDVQKHIGSILEFRLFRDPTDALDTYAGDAGLLNIGIHFDNDSVGSDQITTKTRGM